MLAQMVGMLRGEKRRGAQTARKSPSDAAAAPRRPDVDLRVSDPAAICRRHANNAGNRFRLPNRASEPIAHDEA